MEKRICRQTERHTNRQTDSYTHQHRYAHTHTHTHTHTPRYNYLSILRQIDVLTNALVKLETFVQKPRKALTYDNRQTRADAVLIPGWKNNEPSN